MELLSMFWNWLAEAPVFVQVAAGIVLAVGILAAIGATWSAWLWFLRTAERIGP